MAQSRPLLRNQLDAYEPISVGLFVTHGGRHGPLDTSFPLEDDYTLVASWSDVLMNIEDWLRSLGLERYEAAFRENEIDDTILPRLTAEDLKELGVGPVGHRRKLLDAMLPYVLT